jgi:hypothetical protein
MITARVKYNGNHYFSGESVCGEYFEKDGKHYIRDKSEDEFGSVDNRIAEIDPETLKQGG